MSSGIPQITGPGHYDIEIVGESHYLAHFIKICGPRCRDGVEKAVRALLILDDANRYDKLAVRIDIEGGTVGHLPRDTARDFRKAVKKGRLTEYSSFECSAIIRGGWDDGNGNAGHYGVWLDLPQDD
jgi:hypothetical protein